MLSLVAISAGVTKDLISKMKECAVKDTGEVGWLVGFQSLGFYIHHLGSE